LIFIQHFHLLRLILAVIVLGDEDELYLTGLFPLIILLGRFFKANYFLIAFNFDCFWTTIISRLNRSGKSGGLIANACLVIFGHFLKTWLDLNDNCFAIKIINSLNIFCIIIITRITVGIFLMLFKVISKLLIDPS